MGSSKRDPRAYPVPDDPRALQRLLEVLPALAAAHPVLADANEAVKRGIHPIDAARLALMRLVSRPTSTRLRCEGASDGECNWEQCPQLIDGEPERSGRHCPLDLPEEEY